MPTRSPVVFIFASLFAIAATVRAHIVPPEELHPVAESYRRMAFLVNLNPVPWNQVQRDVDVMLDALVLLDAAEAGLYRREAEAILGIVFSPDGGLPTPEAREDTPLHDVLRLPVVAVLCPIFSVADTLLPVVGHFQALRSDATKFPHLSIAVA